MKVEALPRQVAGNGSRRARRDERIRTVTLIQWDSRLALNVGLIDNQHQKLVAMVNSLNAAMLEGKGKEAVGRILDGLVSYTQYHFGAEERLMDQHGYPESPMHKSEHLAFVKRIGDFKEEYSQGTLGLSIGVMTFLSDWLRNHIMGTDKKYVPHMVEKGVR
jgi:hemerythrin